MCLHDVLKDFSFEILADIMSGIKKDLELLQIDENDVFERLRWRNVIQIADPVLAGKR